MHQFPFKWATLIKAYGLPNEKSHCLRWAVAEELEMVCVRHRCKPCFLLPPLLGVSVKTSNQLHWSYFSLSMNTNWRTNWEICDVAIVWRSCYLNPWTVLSQALFLGGHCPSIGLCSGCGYYCWKYEPEVKHGPQKHSKFWQMLPLAFFGPQSRGGGSIQPIFVPTRHQEGIIAMDMGVAREPSSLPDGYSCTRNLIMLVVVGSET